MENDKQTLVQNYMNFENKNIYTIHEVEEEFHFERKSEENIQPTIDESDNKIPSENKKHIYLIQMFYKIFYQMICASQLQKND